MVIAIDGPAGSGKSTIAKRIAKILHIEFLNTGSFYRGITLSILRSLGSDEKGAGGVDPDFNNQSNMIDIARSVSLMYSNGSLFLGDENVEDFIRSDRVEKYVAQLSAIVDIRNIVNQKFSDLAKNNSLVCEGRDMTTVVFPNADYKFYLDASVHARALRRYNQGTSIKTLEEIEATIAARDDVDMHKSVGSLKIAPDAIYIDTSDLTIDQVCDMIICKIHL